MDHLSSPTTPDQDDGDCLKSPFGSDFELEADPNFLRYYPMEIRSFENHLVGDSLENHLWKILPPRGALIRITQMKT